MLDKLAQISAVRDSEVRGCLAAFVDSGIMKVASEEDFDALSSAVAANIGLDYDIDTIYKTASYLLGEGQEKTAAEQHNAACMAALGELLMMKTAGQIDDATFTSEAHELMKVAKNEVAVMDGWNKKKNEDKISFNKKERSAIRGKKVKDAINSLSSKIPASVKKYGPKAALGAGLVGAGALGTALYNKYSK